VGNGMRRLFIPLAALLIAAALSATASAGSLTAEDKRLTKAAFAAIEQEHWAQDKDIIARANNPLARKLIEAFEEQSTLLAKTGKTLVVVTTPILRRELASLVRQAAPDGLVLSFKELPETKRINVVAVIGGAS